ncbi:hypothetical protein ACQPYA_02885 [Micromonospora sp. CA-263727]|uniref:hypothetical protein n=1 Tax=Micromonospora sp. CA-263727 TaxID=3239967 RepID=UPI003D8A4F71
MTPRIRYALRTLLGPWLVVPAFGMEAAIFLTRGMPWRGEGLWTVDWFAISIFIIGPLCSGVAAIDAARLSRPGNIHLVVSVSRSGWAYLRAAAWCAIPLVCLHLLTIAVALIVGRVGHPSVSWWSLVAGALVQCLGIVWYVALGSAIGRFTGVLVAGLVGGVGAFILSYAIGGAFASEPTFQLLNLGSATITMIGKSFSAAYLASQAVLFITTAAIFMTLRVQPRSGLRVPSTGATVAAIAAVAAIGVAPVVLPGQRYDSTPHPPTACAGTRPEICLYPEHERYAALVSQPINALAQAAQANGYLRFMPERIIEESRSYRPSGPGVFALYLPTSVYEDGLFSLEDAASTLLNPTHCQFVQDPSVGGVDMEQFAFNYFSLLTTWLQLAGVEDVSAPTSTKHLSPQEASTILDSFANCRLDVRL